MLFITFCVKKPTLCNGDTLAFTSTGLHHNLSQDVPTDSFLYSSLWVYKQNMRVLTWRKFSLAWLIQILSGDIELNPGPDSINNITKLEDLCSKKGLKLLHQNIRGLQGSFDELKNILLRNKIDVFGLTEIFVNKILPDSMFSIPGYTFIRIDRNSGSGGGVGVYIRNGIDYTRRIGLENDSYESIWIEIKPKKSKPIILGIIYRPPDSSTYLSKDFNQTLNENLLTLDKESKETIIMGDINVDYVKDNDHREIKISFTNNGFKQLLKTPTRITPTSATLIDIIHANNSQNISHTAVIPSSLSDHDLTACVRKMNNIKYAPENIRCRDYRNYDVNQINNDLLNVNWEQVYNKTSSSEAWKVMETILKETLNTSAPFISKRIKGKPSPWITDRIKTEMNSRDQLMRKARKSKKYSDWKLYRQKRNYVNNEIKRTKRSYYKTKLTENATNPDKFWKTIKEIFPAKSKERKLPNSFKLSSHTINDKHTIANEFCRFFITVANNLKKKAFPLVNLVWKPKNTAINFTKHQFSFRNVTEQEVLKHLKHLKRKCAVGLDDIPSSFLKDTAYVIAKPLTHIINCSLRNGTVPDSFKHAKVTPIFKSGAQDILDNYRPISVLPTVSNVLESCVHNQLMEHLENHNLLSSCQFGFRKNRSTEHASVYFTDKIRKAMDSGLFTGAIYIDLSKAFDTISHSTLIDKLPDFGITGISQDWFSNYLFGRYQLVTYKGQQSSLEPIFCGVPQGSILGPLLFLLHFNDVTTALSNCQIVKYADDTVIFYSHKDIEKIEQVLNEELSHITKWLQENELIVNTKKGKTEVMIFGTGRRLKNIADQPIEIKHQETILNQTNTYKYLGLTLNCTLNMSEHVQTSLKRAASRVNLLKKMRRFLDEKTAALIYNAMILPIITYCCFATYGTTPPSLDEKIVALERRAQKIVGNDVTLPSSNKINTKRVVTYAHRCIHGITNSHFKNYFEVQKSNINTRNNGHMIRLQKVKIEAARSSFYFQGAVAFNKLPRELRMEKDIAKFKSLLKKL